MSAGDNLSKKQFRTVYHGVEDPSVIPAIQREGLRPMYHSEVYTSPSRSFAGSFGDHVVQLRVPADMLHEPGPGDPRRGDTRLLQSGPIPPEHIVKWHVRRGNHRPGFDPYTPEV